jgi:hypothetical protein
MASDTDILRRLAGRLRQIADEPANLERRRLWLKHNSLAGERPMVLAEMGGVMNEIAADWRLECTDEWARRIERRLRTDLWRYENVGDDAVVEPYWNINWQVEVSDYGVREDVTRGDAGERMGSYVWDHPIKDLDRDFDRLHARTYCVDRAATAAHKARLEALLDGLLTVRIRGGFWWTLGMTWAAIRLIGLENLMLYMVDNPAGLHRLMAFLRDDHLAFAEWLQREGLLSLNNANDYIGSGGHGYCAELPAADWREGDPVRLRDLWVLSESQETVGVGPEMFEEFVFAYQLEIVKRFGLTYYGCCEPVHSRWHVIRRIPNLRHVSISPWCHQEKMAAELKRDYVFCRKPNPSLISTERFDEAAIRADLRHTLSVARGCEVELVMKDVHTLSGQPHRLGRWVQLAREVVGELY